MGIVTAFTRDLYDFVNQISDPEPLVMLTLAQGRGALYYPRLDRVYLKGNNAGGSEQPWGFADPMFNDGTKPITDFSQTAVSGAVSGYAAGEWNRTLGTQKLYSLSTVGAAGRLQERHYNTFEILQDNPFPLFRNTCTEVGVGVDGYYVSLSLDYVIFETEQKLIMPMGDVYYQSTLYQDVAIEVDLTTGLGVPIEGMPGQAEASPNIYNEPLLFGDTVNWQRIQFVEDDDSTHLNQKGYFFLSEKEGQVSVGIDASEYAYVRKLEWNPNGVSGSPNRVHKRITLTSRVEFDETIINFPFTQASLVVHPLSQRIFWLPNNGTNPATPGSNILYIFGTVAALADISAAAPESTPRTAGTTAFNVEALGSLNEKIPGISVEFSLEGASTLLELLDTSAGVGGAAVAVDYIPIDDDTGLEVWELPAGGSLTLLEETTHYMVNYATGVITGAGGHWIATSVYYATYNHKTNTTGAPALGTLLTPIVTTDSFGKARTRIRYPDNDDLVIRYDNLKADTI